MRRFSAFSLEGEPVGETRELALERRRPSTRSSSAQVRCAAPEAEGPPLAEVSPTEVREQLQQGLAPQALVPRAVLAYAQAHGLYGR